MLAYLVIYTSLDLSALSIRPLLCTDAHKSKVQCGTTLFPAGLLIVLFSEVEAGQALGEHDTMLIRPCPLHTAHWREYCHHTMAS